MRWAFKVAGRGLPTPPQVAFPSQLKVSTYLPPSFIARKILAPYLSLDLTYVFFWLWNAMEERNENVCKIILIKFLK